MRLKTRFFLSLFVLSYSALGLSAQEAPQFFAFEGRLYQVDGATPLTDVVNFKFQILNQNTTGNPVNDCVLYEEVQNGVNLSATAGVFNLVVGSNTGATKRSGSDGGLSLTQIFDNSKVITAPVAQCPAGNYTPSAGSIRRLRVTVTNTGTGATETLSPDLTIGSVPQAIVAETLQGLAPTDFLKVDGTSAMTEALTFDTWATGGRPSSPAVGSTGFNTTTGYLESWNGSGWVDYSAGSGGGSLSGLTAGRVPFATSGTALGDDSNLFWDNTNKRLGVGTTTPAEKLSVNGTVGITSWLVASGNIATNSNFQQNSATGSNYFSSNLGIGTTTPASPLDVTSATATYSINGTNSKAGGGYGVYGNASGATGVNIGVYGYSASSNAQAIGVWGRSNAGYGVLGQSNSGNSGLFSSNSSSNTAATLVTQQNGASSANLFEAQNGTGTTLSYINSSGYFYQPGTPTAATNQAATTSYVDSAVTGASGNAVNKDGTTQLTGNWNVGNRAISNISTLSVGSTTAPTGGVAYFNGNVGIGTTSPGAPLHVQTATTTAVGEVGSFRISDSTTPNKRLFMGIDTSLGALGAGYIQANHTGSGAMDLYLQPLQGTVRTGPISATGAISGQSLTLGYGAGAMAIGPDGSGKDLQFYSGAGFTTPTVMIKASGNVGIGTTNPTMKLDIDGGAGRIRLNPDSVYGNSFIQFGTSGAPDRWQMGYNWGGTIPSQGFTIANDSSGHVMTLAYPSGNVGIGTTNPTYLLEANGRSKATSFAVGGVVTDLTNSSPWYGLGKSSIFLGGLTNSGEESVQLAGYFGVNIETGTGTAMSATSDGRIGFSIRNPQAMVQAALDGAASKPLFLASGIWFTGGTSTTTKPSLLVEPWNVGASNAWSTSGTGIGVNAKTGFAGNLMDLQVEAVSKFKVDKDGKIYGDGSTLSNLPGGISGLTAGRVPFAATSSTISDDGGLTWDNSTKNLQINGANASNGLSVSGRIYAGINDGNDYSLLQGLNVNTGGGIALSLTAGGQLGTLTSYGGTVTANGAKKQASLSLLATSGMTGGLSLAAADAAGDVRIYSGGSANANERITVKAAGNVGVGTTSPSVKFEVSGGPINATGYGGGGEYRIGDQSILYRDNTGMWIGDLGSNLNPVKFYTNGNERARIDTSGNVGIGTTTPGAKLDVSGDVLSNTRFAATTSGGAYRATMTQLGNEGIFQAANSLGTNTVQFHSNGTSYINGGNLGVGTSTPATNLDVKFGTQAHFTVGNPGTPVSGEHYVAVGFNEASNYASIQPYTHNVGYRNLILNSDGGNVGIGTTALGAKLHVSASNVNNWGTGTPTLTLENTNGTGSTNAVPTLKFVTPTGSNSISVLADQMYVGGGIRVSTSNVGIMTGSGSTNGALGVNGGVAIGSSAYWNVAAPPTNGMIVEGNVGIGTTAPSTNSRLAIKDGHLQSQQTTAPGVAVHANAGSGASCTLSNATDVAGKIDFTTGSSGWAAGTQCTITFNKSYATAPIVTLTAANGAAALVAVAKAVYASSTTTTFTIEWGNAAASSQAYSYFYQIIETQ